jgi:hypothetical protein
MSSCGSMPGVAGIQWSPHLASRFQSSAKLHVRLKVTDAPPGCAESALSAVWRLENQPDPGTSESGGLKNVSEYGGSWTGQANTGRPVRPMNEFELSNAGSDRACHWPEECRRHTPEASERDEFIQVRVEW